MRKVKKAYNWKIGIITTIAILVSTITLYSEETLRCPLNSQVTDVIQKRAEIELSWQLASDDKDERHKALDILEKIDNPEQIRRIVERVFANRGLELRISSGDEYEAVEIIDAVKKETVGYIDFCEEEYKFEKALMGVGIEINTELQDKHLFTLMWKWMAVNDNLITKFHGKKIVISGTHFKVARAIWRSGFRNIEVRFYDENRFAHSIDDIKKGEYYIVSCRFPFKQELAKRKKVITPNLASVIFARSQI